MTRDVHPSTAKTGDATNEERAHDPARRVDAGTNGVHTPPTMRARYRFFPAALDASAITVPDAMAAAAVDVPSGPVTSGEHHEERSTQSIAEHGGRAARDASAMLISRLIIAVLGWSGSVLIARSLGAEEWGRYSLIFGILGLLSVITDLGVGRVVLQHLVLDSNGRTNAAGNPPHLVASSFIALRLVLGLVGYLVALAYVIVAGYDAELVEATAIAGLVVVVATPSHALSVLFQSRLMVVRVAVIEALAQVVQLGLTVAAVVYYPMLIVLVIPAVVYEVISLLGKSRLITSGKLGFTPSRVIEVWRWWPMLAEAVPLSIGMALVTLLTKVDILLLGRLGTFDAVGQYAIGYKFADLVSTIGIAITTPAVTLFVASWPHNAEMFRRRTRQSAVAIAILGGFCVAGIWPSARALIETLYGTGFADVDFATRMLVLSSAVSSLTLLGIMALVSTGKHRVFPWVAAAGLLLNIVLNILVIPRFSFNGAAVATLVTESLLAVAIWWVVIRSIPIRGLLPARALAGIALVTVTIIVAADLVTSPDAVWSIGVGVVAALLVPVLAYLTRSVDGQPIPDSIRRRFRRTRV